MLKRQIVSSLGRQHWRRNRTSTHGLRTGRPLCLLALTFGFMRVPTTLSGLLLIVRLRRWMRRASRRGRGAGSLPFQISALLVIPGRLVVGLLVLVEAGVQAVFGQFESLFDDECRVGVIDEVVVCDPIVLDRVIDESAQKRDIGSGANLQIEVGVRGRTRQPWIHDDGLRVTVN